MRRLLLYLRESDIKGVPRWRYVYMGVLLLLCLFIELNEHEQRAHERHERERQIEEMFR